MISIANIFPITVKDTPIKLLVVASNIVYTGMLFSLVALASTFIMENSILAYIERYTKKFRSYSASLI